MSSEGRLVPSFGHDWPLEVPSQGIQCRKDLGVTEAVDASLRVGEGVCFGDCGRVEMREVTAKPHGSIHLWRKDDGGLPLVREVSIMSASI